MAMTDKSLLTARQIDWWQGCAITIARRPGLPIFRVGLAKTNAVLARRATKLRSKYKIDRNHVQDRFDHLIDYDI